VPNFTKQIIYQLVTAAAATGIATSQALTAGTKMTLNGSLVSGGVATLDTGGAARRVIITPAGNETTNSFTIVGTDRYGRPQTEVLAGVNNPAVAQSTKDFKTVTSITPTNNGAGNASAGTNGVGSSAPMIADWNPNGNQIGCTTVVTGTVNYTIEEARDDLAPAWDLTINNPTWVADPTFNALTAIASGNLPGPFTMIRVTINSGTGSVTAKIITPFIGGRI
jgi:hypothetical protein